MEDLLSFALNEAGLDEFFLSNSNDGFIDGQPAATAAGGSGSGAATAAAQTAFPMQTQLLQQPPPPPQPLPKVIIVPRSAPPVPPANPLGDLLANAVAAFNDELDEDPLMILSNAAASSAAPAPSPPRSAPAAAASLPRISQPPVTKTAPVDTGQTSSRAVGGAESTLKRPAPAVSASAAAHQQQQQHHDGPPLLRPSVMAGVGGGGGGTVSGRVTPMGRMIPGARLGTPESQSRSASAGPVVRRVVVGATGQISRPSTTAGVSTPTAPAAAPTSTADSSSAAAPVQVALPAPGNVVRKKVLLKRTIRGPNGPQTTQTHAIMTIDDKGDKAYYTIPSPGGTSTLITTLAAPGMPSAPVVRQTTNAAGASAAAPPAAAQQQPQQPQQADAAAAAAGGGTPQIVARRRPGEQPRRIVVVRQGGGSTVGSVPGGGGTVVRRVSAAGTTTTLLRTPQGYAGGGGMQRGGFVQRTSNLAASPMTEGRYGGGQRISPPNGVMIGGRMTVTRPGSAQGNFRGGIIQQQHRVVVGGGGSAAGAAAPRAPPGNTASYTTYQRSAYPRGGLHAQHSTHSTLSAHTLAAHGHQYGRGGGTTGPRLSRGFSGQNRALPPPGIGRMQHLQQQQMGRTPPSSSMASSQQQAVNNMTAYSPMPRGVVGHQSSGSAAESKAEMEARRRSVTPGLVGQSSGPGGMGGGGGGGKAAPSPALPKMAKTAKEEMQKAIQMASVRALRNDIDEEEENLGHAETYADYKPAKLRSGQSHPDSVVETASLSSVAPPDVKYQINIPEYLIDTGAISALQLEAVIYACQMHENILPNQERLGYLIGDGAGVGKGRTVACIIFENYLLGRRRALWLSVSNDLRFDSERDLRDIGAGNIQVHSLNKMKYSKISGKENGNIKKGVMFATYSSLIGECRTAKRKYQSRLKQLIQWLGVDFDGCIVFDECHRAKNLVPSTGAKPTKTGQMVLELQRALPKARVVYASATGATEPRNMAYMTRLGLWGPGQAFLDFGEFINAVERRGVGAMEIVAMDMKQRGLYLARQLSFRGVNFNIQEVQLSPHFVGVYDESVKLWVEVRRQFQTALAQMDEEDRLSCKHIWGQFWASHQRFFKYLCIAAKVDACVQITRDAIAAGKCVVIGLQSTGESRTLEAIDDMGGELTEFVSTAKAVLGSLIDKHFPSAGDFQTDIFRDFDRMFGDGEKRRRKKPMRSDGMDVLEELGLGPSTSSGRERGGRGERGGGGPRAKRMKTEDGSDDDNSTTSSSGDESVGDGDEGDDDDDDEEDGLDDEEDEEEEAGEFKLGEKDEDWLKALLAEAASSSEEEDGDDDSDTEKKVKKEDLPSTSTSKEMKEEPVEFEEEEDAGEEEFNPFACDFSRDDPWASKQQVVEDSPKKKQVDEVEEERKKILEERRRERRRLRKRKKRKVARKLQKMKAEKEKRALASEAVKKTASDFMTSSRLVDGDPETFNPQMVKAELLAAVERLGPNLPANTLDQLIDDLGGPEFVAEMTGRKGRIVQREDGEVEYELRHTGADVPLELMNMDEKDKFMKGEKVIAIISEAASSGISLQSDRRAPNHRRRVHITLELPWSADKAIQQFGRTHRSNQVSAPEYIFLISELAGEKRFASIVAKRLESLGALTHGDRRATESRDLSQFNFDTKYGRSALDVLLRSVIGQIRPPLIPPPEDYKPGNFFQDMCVYLESVGVFSVPPGTNAAAHTATFSIERDASTIAKFLNRILGLPVHAQNALFAYFADILAELIQQAKHDGTYDMGIMDLGTGGDQVRKLETRVFLGRRDKGSFRVEMHKIGVERGVSWDDAHAIWKEHNTGEDGFYVSCVGAQKKKIAALVYGIGKKRLESGARLYAVTRPSTGRSAKLETFAELSKRFEKTTPEEARAVWEEQYDGSNKQCQHAYVHGKCKNEASGTYCEVGRRTRTYFVLSGSVLSVWPVVEDVLSSGGRDRRANRMQVIRVRTDSDQKIVGLLVLPQYVRTLISSLEEHCGRCYVDDKKDPPLGTAANSSSSSVPSSSTTPAAAAAVASPSLKP